MTALLIVAVLVLVLVNGFFVAAEFALVRASRARLEEQARAGVRGAAVAVRQQDDLSQYLSACQFGITLASLGIGFLGEPAIAQHARAAVRRRAGARHGGRDLRRDRLRDRHQRSTSSPASRCRRSTRSSSAETVARRCARPLGVFEIVMRPFIAGLNDAANWILRLMRIDPDAATEEGGTPEDLKLLITQARTGGQLDPGEAGMLAGVFHLHEQEARQVMTPIPAVVTVDVSDDAETALRRCVSSGHTRLVVTEDENPDRIRGTSTPTRSRAST